MGILTEDLKRLVSERRLGLVATVFPDGTPNLSPKGTTAVWDDDHIVFADIRSPATVSNLRRNPSTEINVVDPVVPKGYERKCSTSLIRCNARNPPLGREEMGLGLYQEPGGETVTALFLPETTDSLFL